MKKLTFVAILAILTLILVACSGQTTEANGTGNKVEVFDNIEFTPGNIAAFFASRNPEDPYAFYTEGGKVFLKLYNGTTREMNAEEYLKFAYPLAESYARYRAREEYEATDKSKDLISTVFAYVYGNAFEFSVKNGEEILDYHVIEIDDNSNIYYVTTQPMSFEDYINYLSNSAIQFVEDSKLTGNIFKVNVNEYSFYIYYENGDIVKIEYTENNG